MKRKGRRRTRPWLALLALALMWTSADGARRADAPAPRPPAAQPAPPPASPTPELH